MQVKDLEIARHLANEIDGWMSDAEGEVLFDLASKVPAAQAIVEIRSWGGKSTIWLAMGASGGNGSKVYSVDPQGEADCDTGADVEDRYPTMIANLKNAGVRDRVTILPGRPEVVAQRRRLMVGLLWLDAFQDYDSSKIAFAAWRPRLMPGAVVAVNDSDQPEPSRFIDECLVQSSEFSIIRTIDTTVLAQYDTCVHHWVLDTADTGVCRKCGRTRSFHVPQRRASRTLKG